MNTTNNSSSHHCHICDGVLQSLNGFQTLVQVTSDCRPWRTGGRLAVCSSCGAVQKPATPAWMEEANEIYAHYDIYSQGGGAEQTAFDAGGASAARSSKIVEWLAIAGKLPSIGKMLDIGCGNGAFLRAFSQSYPGWELAGLELSDRNRTTIEAIPGVTQLHIGALTEVNQKFDLIVLIHALEHIPDPVAYLRSLTGHLNPGGRLLIEVPDLTSSPFDILIADHTTHFTAAVLPRVINAAGFTVQSLESGFIPKELSLLAQFCGDLAKDKITDNLQTSDFDADGGKKAAAHIAWLQALYAQASAEKNDCGIFGTSISATWLAASLGDQVRFFIDEDANRIGRSHMGRPIFSPADTPQGSTLLVPLRADIAQAIARRFDQLECRFVLPPA
ncbi:SAM-dependent methyltransferase [Herbaspirillum sp. Sphag1AN]|uniref:class I SAM-dependent methyltransferase n=1 Tax=unclassified Herbaspirillum TaxID=2624150 RepID=UPI0016070E6A|nr:MULTISPECIES: class I SAM-dependent methyltransferase [unclassified Herbaspirillum]MBB3212990.1 SAM-dependent methyltransferase [Herbaspirillum sp. Sphag1AN]MBB3246187.1 SAM-dependent methyltransferase [Herbaspirillum sp. Sphag64]